MEMVSTHAAGLNRTMHAAALNRSRWMEQGCEALTLLACTCAL
jgi:hypothetical protein